MPVFLQSLLASIGFQVFFIHFAWQVSVSYFCNVGNIRIDQNEVNEARSTWILVSQMVMFILGIKHQFEKNFHCCGTN